MWHECLFLLVRPVELEETRRIQEEKQVRLGLLHAAGVLIAGAWTGLNLAVPLQAQGNRRVKLSLNGHGVRLLFSEQ